MKDDKGLPSNVLDELQWEPSVDAAEIGVTARDGVEHGTQGRPFLDRAAAAAAARARSRPGATA